MGGHGGINILHQKKWHVYNSDNQAKVKRDIAQETDRQRLAIDKGIAAELNKVYSRLRKDLLGSHQHHPKETSAQSHQPLIVRESQTKMQIKTDGLFGELVHKKSWIKELPRDANTEIKKKIHKNKGIAIPTAKGLNLKKR